MGMSQNSVSADKVGQSLESDSSWLCDLGHLI